MSLPARESTSCLELHELGFPGGPLCQLHLGKGLVETPTCELGKCVPLLQNLNGEVAVDKGDYPHGPSLQGSSCGVVWEVSSSTQLGTDIRAGCCGTPCEYHDLACISSPE